MIRLYPASLRDVACTLLTALRKWGDNSAARVPMLEPYDNPAAWDEVRALGVEEAADVLRLVAEWRDMGTWAAIVCARMNLLQAIDELEGDE